MDGPGRAVNPAFGNRANVIGVDIQSNSDSFRIFQAAIGRHTAKGFRQQHRCASMQNAKRLHGTLINRHAAFDIVVANFKVLDTHVADRGVFAGFGKIFKVRGAGPDCHRGLVSMLFEME